MVFWINLAMATDLPAIGQASAVNAGDLLSTLEQRLDRMMPGRMMSQHKCVFSSRMDLDILLLTMERAMANSSRIDVQQGLGIVKGFRDKTLFIILEFKKFRGKYSMSFYGVEGGGHFDIWFRVTGNQLIVTSFGR